MLKCEDVRLSIALPKVVVGSRVIVGVFVIVMYGGDCAFAKPTILSAHMIEMILEMYFFMFIILPPTISCIISSRSTRFVK